MSEGYRVDLDDLEDIARRLAAISRDVDALGSGVPGVGEAGPGTAAVQGILTALVRNAVEVVTGTAAAGDEVTASKEQYRLAEDRADADARTLHGGL